VAVLSTRDVESARRLLDPEFTAWHLQNSGEGAVPSESGPFAISDGVLYIRGTLAEFRDDEHLGALVARVTALADRVASFA
jgi:hypothetical protein